MTRRPFTDTVAELPVVPLAEREAAATGPATLAEHHRRMADWACLRALEVVQPPPLARPASGPLRVAAWNIERGMHLAAMAALLAARDLDVVLVSETDVGCARSGQHHTTAELARALGFGHVYAVEFVELGLGNARETAAHPGEVNERGLHGNAVLSRFPIGRVAVIPLDDGGHWFVRAPDPRQRRIGGRIAVATEILRPDRPFWAVSVHFESDSTPDVRAAQAERLLAGLADRVGAAPVVLGGDLNVFELGRQGLDDREMFAEPARVEPCFAVFAAAGFDWRSANAPGVTTRPHPWEPADRPRLRIDWLMTRDFAAAAPWIAPALGADGTVLSDHDPIGADLT